MKKIDREWRLKNPGRVRERARRYARMPQNRIKSLLLGRIYEGLRKSKMPDLVRTFIGCSYRDLRRHIESLFRPGMSWENWGTVWQLDHKRPCCAFDLTVFEQRNECFHWTNLRPLFTEENKAKMAEDVKHSIHRIHWSKKALSAP